MTKKRHHYIPEVLCKRFTKDDRILYRLDFYKKESDAIPISIKDAFVQTDLNTLNILGIRERDFIEDYLDKEYERTFGKSIIKIYKILFENEKDKTFETEDYNNLLKFCILSHLRTPKKLREIHIQALRRSYLFSVFAKSADNLPKVDNNYILLQTLFDGMDTIINHIHGMTLSIAYHTFDDEYFLLPDQPVTLINTNNIEFDSSGLEIILPVSNNAVLIFSKNENKGNITHIMKKETVENINKQLCSDFFKYIACADKKYLEDFVSRNKLKPDILPEIIDIVFEKSNIIAEIKKELEINPVSRFIRINKNGIEFLI